MTAQPPPPPGNFQPNTPDNHPRAITVLVLGIVSLVCCGFLGPVAWILGNRAVAEIDANPSVYGGRTQANVGRILGIVATVLLILGIISWIVIIALGGLSASDSMSTEY